MGKLQKMIMLRIFMRLLRRYGEDALARRLQGEWLTQAVQKRVYQGRRVVH